MNNRQFNDLRERIEQWTNEWCEDASWPDIIVGDKTVDLMAEAARNVFDACEESQAFMKREGYIPA